MDKCYADYKDKAEFVVIYIKEAHPKDGWQVGANRKEKIEVNQPKTLEDRAKLATVCRTDLKLNLPFVLDDMENSVDAVYAGWPDRFYIVGADGKIVYKGAPGPRGFKVAEMEAKLKEILAQKKK